jgi:hypothetical protein
MTSLINDWSTTSRSGRGALKALEYHPLDARDLFVHLSASPSLSDMSTFCATTGLLSAGAAGGDGSHVSLPPLNSARKEGVIDQEQCLTRLVALHLRKSYSRDVSSGG